MTPQTAQTQEAATTAPTWEIDSIFPGGSHSREYAEFIRGIDADLEIAGHTLTDLPRSLEQSGCEAWSRWILGMGRLSERIHLAHTFALCLVSQDVNDTKAVALITEANQLQSRWQVLETSLESFALRQSDAAWEMLLAVDTLSDARFYLDELRRNARLKMPEEQEKLALELAVDGYHAWNQQYEKIAGDLRVEVEDNGQKKTLSLGQNAPRMSDPDRRVRRDAFEKIEDTWQSCADLAAMILNSQAGFRLTLYRNRGWESPLLEPLLYSRMSRETLDAMWQAVVDRAGRLTEYIDAKKRLLGIDRFCWYDQEAPVGAAGRVFTFAEAGDFIVEHIGSVSAEMGTFIRSALDRRWVEAENRPAKRAGGWCSSVPLRRESRIFMTFANDFDGLLTLAHELGHAYHGYVLKDASPFAQHYPMTLAETASIFNELRVVDAALQSSDDPGEKRALLDNKLQGALAFCCNIRARYLFDCRFYEERKKGIVAAAHLNEIMREAQKEAFFGMLDEDTGYHPLFWASKLHFFITRMPFYNFAYTFGFLFAKGVYARALEEGPAFAKRYRALLSDTGRMTTEEVARKHLGVDLAKPDFWNTAVASAMADIDPFVALCEEPVPSIPR